MKIIVLGLTLAALSTLAGCGYEISHKEITLWDDKGNRETEYSCGNYMRVSSEGWGGSTFEVTFTDANGLSHDVHGVKSVAVSDIPNTVQAPMWAFSDYIPGERYSRPDGTLGEPIKEGDIAIKGENQARLVSGKWMPVMVHNTACDKPKN